MLAQAFLLGGHCRIGMEDAMFIDRGVKCKGNRELVEKGVRIIRELGGESYRSTQLDLMGPEILRMLRQAERGLAADAAPIERRIRMRVF